jgi:hypothetical protein
MLTFENKMTINLVTSSNNNNNMTTSSTTTTTVTSNDISSRKKLFSESNPSSKFMSRQTSLQESSSSSDMLIMRSNCASSSSPSPTTPPSHHANASPFIRGSYQSNSLNFGSLSRRAPLAMPIVGMRLNGNGSPNVSSSPHHASSVMQPHAHLTPNGHLHGHYHYHYHHLHSVAAHTHSPSPSMNADHQSFVTVIDETAGTTTGSQHNNSSNLMKTPENRMNSHHRHSIRRIGPASKSPAAMNRNSPRAISPTPSTVGTDSVWYEYGCV